jgi:PAS domain S-box-containing protein
MKVPPLAFPILLFAALAVFGCGLVWNGFGEYFAHWWINSFWTGGAAIATWEAWRTRKGLAEGPRKIVWTLFTLGCGAWLLGLLNWNYRELVQQIYAPFPDYVDVGCLALLVFFISGLFLSGSEAGHGSIALRKLCNIAILLCGLTVILLLMVPDAVLALKRTPLEFFTASAYVVLSAVAVVFGLICLALYARAEDRRWLGILVTGLAAHGLANCLYARGIFSRTHTAAQGADFLYLLSFVLIVWAARDQRLNQGAFVRTPECRRTIRRSEKVEAVFPALMFAAIGTVAYISRDRLPPELWDYTFPVFLLLIFAIALREWWNWRTEAHLDAELSTSENRFRQIMDANITGIFFWDLDGRVTDANNAFLAMLGFSREELIAGRVRWSDLTPAEYAEADRRAINDMLQGSACAAYEKEFLCKNGSRVPVMVAGSLLTGTREQCVSILVDLSGRRTAEEALLQTQQRLQLFLDHSPASIFMKDAAGRYLDVNCRFLEHLGQPLDHTVGRTAHDLFPPELASNYEAQDAAVKTAGAMVEFQLTSLLPEGPRTSMVQKFPLYNSAGEFQGIGGIITDITERHAAAEALRISEERYRKLIEGAPDAIFTIALDGTLASSNSAAEMLTGWSREECLGTPYLPLVDPLDVPRAQQIFEAARRGENPPTQEISVLRKGGGIVVLECTATPQREGGAIVGVLCIGRDVTERKQLEKQLRQAQRMESIGQLAGGVAHDFNNLLTVITGHTSLLELQEDMPADMAESVKEIAQAAERAANLTRQLLTFSRKQVMQPTDIDLNTVVSDMTRMLRRLVGEDIGLNVDYGPNLPLVHGDTGMIEQIVLNLVVNARDAMPGGGELTLSTSRHLATKEQSAERGESRTGEYVKFSVADSGSGIAQEHLSRIFEPFYTTKEAGKGTGLGLATVHGVVNQHHGWIEVTSALGEGTRFDVYLPTSAVRQSEAVVEAPALPGRAQPGECVLIVEDEAPLRQMVRMILERYGYAVLEAASGVQALDVWREHQGEIALVLTDMVMPEGLSGPELGKQLQLSRPDLPVIYTSGYTDRVAGREFVLEEGVNFVQKPYQPQKLARVIRDNLDGTTSAADLPALTKAQRMETSVPIGTS